MLDIQEIKKILPHRYPFLLIDRVVEMELGSHIVGFKNVSGNEPFFNGHFPEKPIMPGVLIIEAMAQVGGILYSETRGGMEGKIVFFMAMDNVKFRSVVIPGDRLVLKVKVIKKKTFNWKLEGKGYVDDKLVAEAVLLVGARKID